METNHTTSLDLKSTLPGHQRASWVSAATTGGSSGKNLRTVSRPGFGVDPSLMLISVRYGTPERFDMSCSSARRMARSRAASSSADGMIMFMTCDVIASDNYVNPNPISRCFTLKKNTGDTLESSERSRAMAHLIDSNATLWQNVRALMIKKFGKVNLQAFAKHCGIGIATVQRIEGQKTSIGLAVLDKIADRFDLAAWQLLVPGFEANNPPTLQPVSAQERRLYDKIMSAAKAIVAEETSAEYLKDQAPPGKDTTP